MLVVFTTAVLMIAGRCVMMAKRHAYAGLDRRDALQRNRKDQRKGEEYPQHSRRHRDLF
jgi:hypothetical protein